MDQQPRHTPGAGGPKDGNEEQLICGFLRRGLPEGLQPLTSN